jgi:glycosyltransferase involved in cell wall biosynthesis
MKRQLSRPINVSCLLPKRNNKQYFPNAYQSLCSQRLPYSSILICENHSTDGSFESTYELAEGSSITSVVTPLSPAASVGESLRHLLQCRPSADYYHIASSDDIWSDSFLAVMLKTLQHCDSNVSAIFCDRIYIDNNGSVTGASGNVSLPKLIPQARALPYFLRGNAYNIAGALFRSDVVCNADSFASVTGDAIDWALMIEAARLGDIVYICKPLYKYRIHPSNTATTSGYSPYECVNNWLLDTPLADQFRVIHDSQRARHTVSSLQPLSEPWLRMAKYIAHRSGIFTSVRFLMGLDT